MAVVTLNNRLISVPNSCVSEKFSGVFVLPFCFSVGVSYFVIGLSLIALTYWSTGTKVELDV